jgi:hypothetical protein
MNGRELVLICGFVGCAITFFAMLSARHKRRVEFRTRRLDLLAEALRDPNLDAGTRSELLRALAREHGGISAWFWQRLQQPMLWRVLWFGGGWMTMLLGGTALLTYAMRMGMVRSYDLPGIVMLTALGFGMVTLPLALRELLRRDGTLPSR